MDQKQIILSMFKKGQSIDVITSYIYYSKKDEESIKPKNERASVNRRDVKQLVESTILEDYLSLIGKVS